MLREIVFHKVPKIVDIHQPILVNIYFPDIVPNILPAFDINNGHIDQEVLINLNESFKLGSLSLMSFILLQVHHILHFLTP